MGRQWLWSNMWCLEAGATPKKTMLLMIILGNVGVGATADSTSVVDVAIDVETATKVVYDCMHVCIYHTAFPITFI